MYKKVMISTILAVFMITGAIAQETARVVNLAVNGPIVSYPVTADVAEDMIAYDTSPSIYWTNLINSGTMFAVRFTPLQACTLSYVQIASWNTAGNASLHVMSDNGGNPGTDIITPFTVSLNGATTYQSFNLPTPIDVGEDDFHVVLEYTRQAPPYVLGDNDANTESRSKYKVSGGAWTVLNHDISMRAWVNYYGDDQVPPVIAHTPPLLGFSYNDNHVITAAVTDEAGIASVDLHYSTDGVNWPVVAMTNTEGDVYEGNIPSQQGGSTVLYYISAIDASPNSNEGIFPSTAPETPCILDVVEGYELAYDDGTGDLWYYVDTTFNNNAFAKRMTPSSYPAKVMLARALVSDDAPFDFTINSVVSGNPGDILPGGEAIQASQGDNNWAICELADGPVINNGHFFLVFNWRQDSPGNPAVALDTMSSTFRSYWHYGTDWHMDANGEYMMRVVVATPTGVEEIDGNGSRPANYELIGNYPNPFNPDTDIKYLAPEAGNVRIDIYNVAGQLVKTVLDEYVEAGIKTVTWDGTNDNGAAVNSGVYFYKMTAGNVVLTNKMVLMK